jgi:hypothetical protein
VLGDEDLLAFMRHIQVLGKGVVNGAGSGLDHMLHILSDIDFLSMQLDATAASPYPRCLFFESAWP